MEKLLKIHTSRTGAAGCAREFQSAACPKVSGIWLPISRQMTFTRKGRDFLKAGTPLVWTIYPRSQEVIVHTPGGLARTYTGSIALEFPEILLGFFCTVTHLFE